MDISDPAITFDKKGICNHCREFAEKEKIRLKEKKNLKNIIKEIKGQKGKYNCLVGLSGGVDSSLCLHYLIELGLKPLAFSVDNGWNTKESDENMMRLVEGLKVPFCRCVVDIEKFKELQTAFIKSGTINIEIPTDHILMAITYGMANKYGIKYIISGGNLATEGIMPKGWGYEARDLTFIQCVYRRFAGKNLDGLPTITLFYYLYFRFIKGIKIINLLDYYEYNRGKAKKLLSKKYGWKDYGLKHCESEFTMWFQGWYLTNKFGIDKRKAHFSSLINSGQMTRKEAMRELKKPIIIPLTIHFPNEDPEAILEIPYQSHKEYLNSEFWWNLLSKIYGIIKRFQNFGGKSV